jgi:aconitate hydratase
MAGKPFYLTCPEILGVNLLGRLPPWSSAKDVILHLLGKLTVKGGVGKILEYLGDGVSSLSVPERATIANMGAELGATTSVFPSDDVTRKFLSAQGRGRDWTPLSADKDAEYSKTIDVSLPEIKPLAARPHSPDNVSPVSELAGLKVNQVLIGSCTNSSLKDMLTVAGMLKGRRVHPDVSLAIAPGSRQVLEMLADSGALSALVKSGARILESAWG